MLCVIEMTIQSADAMRPILNGNGTINFKFGYIFSDKKSFLCSSASLSPGNSNNRNSSEQMVGSSKKLMLQDQI